jgi:hypothetical protein
VLAVRRLQRNATRRAECVFERQPARSVAWGIDVGQIAGRQGLALHRPGHLAAQGRHDRSVALDRIHCHCRAPLLRISSPARSPRLVPVSHTAAWLLSKMGAVLWRGRGWGLSPSGRPGEVWKIRRSTVTKRRRFDARTSGRLAVTETSAMRGQIHELVRTLP